MATFRALALLTTNREYARKVRQEIFATAQTGREFLPFTRAAVLEWMRLWPTTPLILRETTGETNWKTGALPAETAIVIFTPFFHRDNERLSYADRFAPDLWAGGEHRSAKGRQSARDVTWCCC